MATTRNGSSFLAGVDDAPPPDRMGDDAEPAEKDDGSDSAGLVSAVHDLAKAFGVKVVDEARAVAAARDICRLSEGYEDPEE